MKYGKIHPELSKEEIKKNFSLWVENDIIVCKLWK